MPMNYKHYHLIGVNGIGLSGVARILLEMGCRVSGSDPKTSDLTEDLKKMGAAIYHRHEASNVEGADYLVVSSAIPRDNPEIVEAQRRGIPILHRAEALGMIMKEHTGIAISGTHGKTTTSSMMASLLMKLGVDPTIAVGGKLQLLNTNARLGRSNYMVVEADESDASFLNLDPRWIVVTSVDVDVNLNVAPYSHLNFDFEKTLNTVIDAFYKFIERLPDNGAAIMCIDDENVRKMLPNVKKPVITYGLSPDAQLRAEIVRMEGFGSVSNVYLHGEFLGTMTLHAPGRHNVCNALAVTAVAMQMGFEFNRIVGALKAYEGCKRRFERLMDFNDILVVDDYAHNPGKVRALLHGAKTGGRQRVIAIFQPHRYTRTKFLFDEFAGSFFDADVLVLTEIYSAGECPIVGVKGETLAEAVQNSENRPREIYYIPVNEEIVEFIESFSRPGDIIITCGAGDIYRVGYELACRLPRKWEELAAG